ncbi:hypothetical protein ACFWZU_15730 [Frateuria sp. GZRR33]|uniref:hypothetical protein n=1 Tax=Frateuria sp. GZRR33 TaxID=3351535 RepID=UPI003EDC8DAB
MNEPTGKAFEIDRRYEAMRAVEEMHFTTWQTWKYGIGVLLLLAFLLLSPFLIIYSLL